MNRREQESGSYRRRGKNAWQLIDEYGWTIPDPPEPEPEKKPVEKVAFTPPEVATLLGVTRSAFGKPSPPASCSA